MDFIINGFLEAIQLIINIDQQTWSAITATLKISLGTMLISLIIGLPIGFILGYFHFPGKYQIFYYVDDSISAFDENIEVIIDVDKMPDGGAWLYAGTAPLAGFSPTRTWDGWVKDGREGMPKA